MTHLGKLLLLVQLSSCFAEQQCSDTLGGACNAPRASLMQIKSLSQRMKAVSGDSTAASRAEALAGFQKFTQDLVDKFNSGELKEVDEKVKNAIDVILQYLEQLYSDFLDYHRDDKAKADACHEHCAPCTDLHIGAHFLSWLESQERIERGMAKRHQACREDRAQACCSASCPEYDRYRQFDEKALLPECAETKFETTQYIQAQAGTDDLGHMEQCLRRTKRWLDPLWDHYINCKRENNDCATMGAKCDEKQTEYENLHCQVEEIRTDKCRAWSQCCLRAHDGCFGENGVCAEIQIRANARKADNETAERIKCLLAVLEGPDEYKAADLIKCNEAEYDTSEWNIHCPTEDDPSPPIPPCKADPHPCPSAYIDFPTYTSNCEHKFDQVGSCTQCTIMMNEM